MSDTPIHTAVLDISDGAARDREALREAAFGWHFDRETRSRFWLESATRLKFHPRSDSGAFQDLTCLLSSKSACDLRDLPVDNRALDGLEIPCDCMTIGELEGERRIEGMH